MGKPRTKTIKLLDRDFEHLTACLGKENYSPAEILGEILMELYDVARGSSKNEISKAHAKVLGILEAVRERADGASQQAYITYCKVYHGLCQELDLNERPAYIPKPAQEPVSASQTQSETEAEQTDKKGRELLIRGISKLILGIKRGNLKPKYFLRAGLDELGDLASEIPFPKFRFSRARQTYCNVMDFLGTSGIYGDVESYRQEYNTLLGRVNGSSQNKPKKNSAGIGRRAVDIPVRNPYGNFRKALSE